MPAIELNQTDSTPNDVDPPDEMDYFIAALTDDYTEVVQKILLSGGELIKGVVYQCKRTIVLDRPVTIKGVLNIELSKNWNNNGVLYNTCSTRTDGCRVDFLSYETPYAKIWIT